MRPRLALVPAVLVSAALAPLLLSACSVAPRLAGPASLAGSTWTATSLPGPVAVPPGQTLTVTFGEDGRLAGQADCNRMFGTYTTGPGASLTVSGVGTTRMFCGEASLGSAFAQALEGSRAYAVSGRTLTVRTGAGVLTLAK